MRHIVITYDHLNDRDWPFTHHDYWKHVKILELIPGQDCVDLDIGALRNVLPEFPALDELRLVHIVILSAPIPSRTSVPLRIRSLTLHTKGHSFDRDDCSDADDDNIVMIFQSLHDVAFGLPKFSLLSAVLSVVVSDILNVGGGHLWTSLDTPDNFTAPMSVGIRQLSIGSRYFDSSYWRSLLEPNTLEHLTVALAWGDRERAVQLRTLLEYAGSAVTTLDLRMGGFSRFQNAGEWTPLVVQLAVSKLTVVQRYMICTLNCNLYVTLRRLESARDNHLCMPQSAQLFSPRAGVHRMATSPRGANERVQVSP